MYVHTIIGERLIEALRRDRLGHTLLFTGGGGRGAYELSIGLAQALLCPAAPHGSIGEAESCAVCRRVRRLAHPDLRFVAPLPTAAERKRAEEDLDPVTAAIAGDPFAPLEVGANWGITAEQARQLIQWAAMTPWEAPGKVAIIAEAEKVTEPTADILLKTLEEPPTDTTVMLVTARPHELLPTVRSRCHEVRVPPLDGETLVALLAARGVGRDDARAVAPLAGGDLWQAQALIGGGTNRVRETAATLIGFALDPKKRAADVVGAAQEATDGASTGDVGELVRWIVWRLRELLLAATGAADASADLAEILPLARRLGPARLTRWIEEADRAWEMLGRNVTPPAVLAALLVYPRDERRLGSEVTFPPLDAGRG